MLWANYFELLPDKDQALARYALSIVPNAKQDEPEGRKRERIVKLLLPQLPQTMALATDYSSTILAAASLGFIEKQYFVTYYAETDSNPGSKAPKFRIKVKYTGTLTFGELLNYLESTNLSQEKPTTKDEIIQAINIIIGYGMKSNTNILTKRAKSSRNKYFPSNGNLVERMALRGGLEAFRGFFMSVRAATGRILLNVQVQHIAVWEAISLSKLYEKMRADQMSDSEISRALSGLWVHATHLKNRLKRIMGLAVRSDGRGDEHPPTIPKQFANADEVRFWKCSLSPPKYVSVTEHFKQAYKMNLSLPKLPVVNVGTRSTPCFLPLEVCTVKKQQDYQKKLSPKATSDMINFAVRWAPANARTISGNGLQLMRQNGESLLGKFGVKIDGSMITVQGRVLAGVPLQYRNLEMKTKDAGWNMRNIKFSRGARLPAWSYLWVTVPGHRGAFSNLTDVMQCIDTFAEVMRKCGLDVQNPLPGRQLNIQNVNDPGPEIDQVFSSIKQVRLLLVLLPSQSTPLYNAVKRAGDITYGIHTIDCVAESKKFAKSLTGADNSQYFANVALKFNLKLGGQNQLLKPADLGFVSEGKTMLVGLDVTHPAPGSSKSAPSISSIVASVDKNLSQWPANVAIQTGRKEMIEGLKDMFKSRLQLWRKHNSGQLPEEVIIYRDGVGETMYDLVRQTELPEIKAACAEIYPANQTKASKPHITIVICGKRHHTRFYPTMEEDADERTGGTRNGTIVDRGVTETRIWDFYLQAHKAVQGTPKSAHYVVVHDEIFRRRAAAKTKDGLVAGQKAADELESLTHAMCYMFGRATKAVSLCPPAYYADLVCDRARRWLSRVFDERTVISSDDGSSAAAADVAVHPNLKDTMFYI